MKETFIFFKYSASYIRQSNIKRKCKDLYNLGTSKLYSLKNIAQVALDLLVANYSEDFQGFKK